MYPGDYYTHQKCHSDACLAEVEVNLQGSAGGNDQICVELGCTRRRHVSNGKIHRGCEDRKLIHLVKILSSLITVLLSIPLLSDILVLA